MAQTPSGDGAGTIMVKLIFIDERLNGRAYEFAGEKTSVGRSSENLLCIRDPSLSRRHCEILVYGTEVIVRDLGSRNGTFVNDKRLSHQQSQLKAGQIVRFGTVEARLEIAEPEQIEEDSSGYFDVLKFARECELREQSPNKCEWHWGTAGREADRTLQLSEKLSTADTTAPFPPEVSSVPSGSKRSRATTIIAITLLMSLLIWLLRTLNS